MTPVESAMAALKATAVVVSSFGIRTAHLQAVARIAVRFDLYIVAMTLDIYA